MKRRFGYMVPLLAAMVGFSCEEETSWELKGAGGFPVADCILTNEMKYQEVRLYHSVSGMNESPAGVAGAMVAVDDGQTRLEFLADPGEAGRYVSPVPFRATAGRRYRLCITTGGIADTAWAEMAGVSPLESMDIVPDDSLYRYVNHGGQAASMTEVSYDWSENPWYCAAYGSCEAAEVFYALKNIDPAKEFAPARQKILFPAGTRIIRKKYGLSGEFQDFIRAMLLETEWRGGLFDAEPGNVPTNFSHGILGWFAVSAAVSDTTDFR